MNFKFGRRLAIQVAGTVMAFFLLAHVYTTFTMPPSIMTKVLEDANRTQTSADFDPAPLSETLQGQMLNKEHIYTKTEISEIVCSIMNHNMSLTAQLECSQTIDEDRYAHLRSAATTTPQIQYFFALDLHQVTHVILPLMGSIIEAMRYLGPERCALSIVEGRSTDGSYDILAGLKQELAAMGVPYFLLGSQMDPLAILDQRIPMLSKLRNIALEPLLEESRHKRSRLAPNPTVVFVNDIVLCPEDVLELLHQRVVQSATVTCSFDWREWGAAFYDQWVSRSMSGNLFFEVSHDGSTWFAQDMFFDHPESADRYNEGLPVQVYSCWGGMITLDANLFLQRNLSFRGAEPGECYMGEPMALAKDCWRLGIGKILAVPSVNVAYEYDEAYYSKEMHGYVHETVGAYNRSRELVEWQPPPGQVKCMPVFERQFWVPPV
ncbi:uncharacterized protein PFLUO_LOCUS8757 [Penicillium psychrofluorescens]|uniref:uncharacterized protein n=1 Tax=Penicillium psychrofluorescens TaxID=3158075 RepID=UPI003CCCEFF6